MNVSAYAQQLTEKYDPEQLKDLLDEACMEIATSGAAQANNDGIVEQLRYLSESDEVEPWVMAHIKMNLG